MKRISISLKALAFACALFAAEESSGQPVSVTPVVNTYASLERAEAPKNVDLELYPIPGTSKILMILENPHEEKLYVTIRGDLGDTYNRFVQQKRVRTVFDLSNAEDGQYTIHVQHRKQKFSRRFKLSTTYQRESKEIKLN